MSKICVIAIDRAKIDAVDACKKLSTEFGLNITAYLLVSEAFKRSPAYRGNESGGYFKEIVLDFDDNELLKKTVRGICVGSNATITQCIIESAMDDYAKIIPYLKNTHAQTPESLKLSSEKSKMRKAMRATHPEICPNFVILNSFDDFSKDRLKSFSFPLIIKPNGLTSSFLVTKCDDYKSLLENLLKTFESIDEIYAREHGVGDKSVIIEEFIEGDMYSIDAYVGSSLDNITYLPPVRVITSYNVGLPGFYGHVRLVPTSLTLGEITAANECVKKTIDSLGLINSTVHVELYNTTKGWKTIELGPRIGGYRQELYKAAFGLEHFYNDLLIHYGKSPDVKLKHKNFAAAINIYSDSEGTISIIDGLKKAREVKSVVWLKQHASIGDHVAFAINGGKYVIDGVLANSDKAKLEKDIELVRKLIKIEVANE